MQAQRGRQRVVLFQLVGGVDLDAERDRFLRRTSQAHDLAVLALLADGARVQLARHRVGVVLEHDNVTLLGEFVDADQCTVN